MVSTRSLPLPVLTLCSHKAAISLPFGFSHSLLPPSTEKEYLACAGAGNQESSFGTTMRDKRSPGVSVSPRLVLFLITAVVLIYGVIYPNLYVLAASFQRSGSWTLANYRDVLTQRTVIEAIVNSLGLSVATVLLCALVGIPLAFLFERYAFPGRQLFAVLAALPLVLPPLVGTVAFIFLCGESGILARSVQALFHFSTAPWSLRGWGALLLFHTYTMYPFFYVLTGAGLQRIDAGLAEAAKTLG